MHKKVVDANNKAVNLFTNNLLRFISENIHCLSISRIISYDNKNHTADCQPLALQADGDKRAASVECIVPASIWQREQKLSEICKTNKIKEPKKLKVGSIVATGFFDTEIDEFKGSKRAFPINTNRQHSLNDGCVMEVIKY